VSRIEILEIGFSPHGEECAQLGEDGYSARARRELTAFRQQLHRHAACEGVQLPPGLALTIKGSSHDFGTYYELVARFPTDDEAATEAAYWLEANVPEKWDEEARAELGLVDS
jgi:hypothetical protein